MRIFRSLLAKYMLIIVLALVLVQTIVILVSVFSVQFMPKEEKNSDLQSIADQWHEEAKAIQNPSPKAVSRLFAKWQKTYKASSMFWVDGNGRMREPVNVHEKLPDKWTPADTARFLKKRYDSNPYTVVAFVGEGKQKGFIVFEIPRTQIQLPREDVYEKFGNVFIIGFFLVIGLFVLLSFLFFRSIRRRLLHLQEAMEIRDSDQLPVQIEVKKQDEIGQLEATFNRMVCELEAGKEREQEEERLRKELIANLSHDLRTPLTKVRTHAYTIGKEAGSETSKQAVQAMEKSISQVDQLVENLLSYTLLSVDKYTYSLQELDIVRFLREQLAAWYPVFEKEGFAIEAELEPFAEKYWQADPLWMGRILDNLFQNVLRHAKSGKYVSVETESDETYDIIRIADHGKGISGRTDEKGAGIGLSIVDMMIKGMQLEWDISSSRRGTVVVIKRRR